MPENESKPQGIPPSQGGKYVGFGSTPPPSANRNNGAAQGGDVMQVISQGLGRLSLVAASAAQSTASVVQVGTKEIQSKNLGDYERSDGIGLTEAMGLCYCSRSNAGQQDLVLAFLQPACNDYYSTIEES
ncbi:hypothetical protein ACQ4PT_000347 [Festuca glaucescens]